MISIFLLIWSIRMLDPIYREQWYKKHQKKPKVKSEKDKDFEERYKRVFGDD